MIESILNTFFFNLKRRSLLLAKIAYSVLLGSGGTVLLAMFLSFFLPAYAIAKFVPWLIGFNAIVTGYALYDRVGPVLKRIRLVSALCGAGNVLIAFAVLYQLMVYATGEGVFSKADLAFYLGIGLVCSELGTLLGIKYVHLKKES